MKLPHLPQAVIFDMDGLLIDTVPLYVEAMVQAGGDIGFPLSPEYIMSLVGLLGNELEKQIFNDHGVNFPMVKFLNAMSIRLEPLLTKKVNLKLGVRELIEKLSEEKIPLGIATSMKNDAARSQLKIHNLTEFFLSIVGRDDVVNSKPHPDIHLKVASNLGVPPKFCVVLEDSFNGVKAAHAAGAMTIMVPDILQPTKEVEKLCVCVVSDLYQVNDILLRV